MIKTMGVQPYEFSESSPYLFLESIGDVLKYLNHDIVMRDEYAFLNRKDISIDDPYEGEMHQKQYWVNGLLVSGLLENLEDETFSKVEKRFDKLIATICNILQRKLRDVGVDSSHNIFVDRDEDYGDIVIGFWKKEAE